METWKASKPAGLQRISGVDRELEVLPTCQRELKSIIFQLYASPQIFFFFFLVKVKVFLICNTG